jgi:imidazole glycerol phosphate synthase subunit HisF
MVMFTVFIGVTFSGGIKIISNKAKVLKTIADKYIVSRLCPA